MNLVLMLLMLVLVFRGLVRFIYGLLGTLDAILTVLFGVRLELWSRLWVNVQCQRGHGQLIMTNVLSELVNVGCFYQLMPTSANVLKWQNLYLVFVMLVISIYQRRVEQRTRVFIDDQRRWADDYHHNDN